MPGDSVFESKGYLGISSVQTILDAIWLAPVKLAQYAMLQIDDPNTTLLRLVSVGIVLLSLAVFYRLIAKWHTHRIAILATLLFATTSYSLHLGRFSNQDAMYYLVIPSLFLFGTWLKSKRYVVRLPLILPAIAILLYLPGFIYFLIPLPLLFRKRLLLAWHFVSLKKRLASLFISVLLIVPLIYSLVLNPSQITTYLGIDRLVDENGPIEFLDTVASTVSSLFFNGPNDPYRWLTGTPILDVASAALAVLGIYAYVKGPHTLRARTLLLFAIISIVLIGTSTVVSIALLLPLVYIVIASGLVFLLQSWFTVFPRNPAARNTAVILMALFITFICSYHVQRYFIAWPNAPETKAALSQKSE